MANTEIYLPAFASKKEAGAIATKTYAKNGMNEISDNTDMSLYETTNCSGYRNWFSSTFISDSDTMGKTSVLYTAPGHEYKMMYFSSNPHANMIDGGFCRWYQGANIEYVANHEFGHFAGLDMTHHSPGTGHTLNEASCEPDWAVIRSGDIAQINGWY